MISSAIFSKNVQKMQVEVPGEGDTIFMHNDTDMLLVNAAGSLNNLTIALPAIPNEQVLMHIVSINAVTNLTITSAYPMVGMPNTLTSESFVEGIFEPLSSTWFRCG